MDQPPQPPYPPQPSHPLPGWYPVAGGHRWWDGARWTEHVRTDAAPAPSSPHSPPHSPPPSSGQGPEASRHRWWVWLPAYTIGLLAFVPALHAAVQLRRRELWRWAGALVAGDVVLWVMTAALPASSGDDVTLGESVVVLLALALAALGTGTAFRLRDEVFHGAAAPAQPASTAARDDPAVLRSRADRRRRADSLALIARDPGLARDLRIGRPDLARDYDDGGLVDVNHVPEAHLVSHLGLTADQAREVVEVRGLIDGFESADDLVLRTDIPPQALDAVRDRVVAL